MPIWNRRRLTTQERWVMAYVRRHPGCTVMQIRNIFEGEFQPGSAVWHTNKTMIRTLIRSAQLKGAPLATTAHGVVIATGSAVHRQAIRMKIHALGELRNAAILMGTRLNDRLAGQIDAMGRERTVVR